MSGSEHLYSLQRWLKFVILDICILAFKNIGVHSKLEFENNASEFFKIWNLIASAYTENIAFPVSVDS